MMAGKTRPGKSADEVVLDVLAYEFPFDEPPEAERKIKRRLRYHCVGPYRQERVDLLRRFKDEIQGEIHRWAESRYFAGRHGKSAAMADFDTKRMIEDFSRSYPGVPREQVKAFVPFAICLYYLR